MKRYIIIIMVAVPIFVLAGEKHWRERALDNFMQADAKLNEVYQQAIQAIHRSELSDDLKKEWEEQQREAQRAWLKFRDKDAKVIEYTWWGGSGMGAATHGWKQKLTEERIGHLREHYALEEK